MIQQNTDLAQSQSKNEKKYEKCADISGFGYDIYLEIVYRKANQRLRWKTFTNKIRHRKKTNSNEIFTYNL